MIIAIGMLEIVPTEQIEIIPIFLNVNHELETFDRFKKFVVTLFGRNIVNINI